MDAHSQSRKRKASSSRSPEKSVSIYALDRPQYRHIDVEYQLLVSERDGLLEAEAGYKRRIEQLEGEAAAMVHNFEMLRNENKMLRYKLDMPDDAVEEMESYNTLVKDREHLRAANKAYKVRIKILENDASEARGRYEKLEMKYKLLENKILELQTEKELEPKSGKLEMIVEGREETSPTDPRSVAEKDGTEPGINRNHFDKQTFRKTEPLKPDEEATLEIQSPRINDEEGEEGEQDGQLDLKTTESTSTQTSVDEIKDPNDSLAEGDKELRKPMEVITLETEEEKCDIESVNKQKIHGDTASSPNKENEQSVNTVIIKLDEKFVIHDTHSDNKDERKTIVSTLEREPESDDLNRETPEEDKMSPGEFGYKTSYIEKDERDRDLSGSSNDKIRAEKMHKIGDTSTKQTKLVEDLKQVENESLYDTDSKILREENRALQMIVGTQAIELQKIKSKIEDLQTQMDEELNKYGEIENPDREALGSRGIGDVTIGKEKPFMSKRTFSTREIIDSWEAQRQKSSDLGFQRKESVDKVTKETVRIANDDNFRKKSEWDVEIMDEEIKSLLDKIKRTGKLRKPPIITPRSSILEEEEEEEEEEETFDRNRDTPRGAEEISQTDRSLERQLHRERTLLLHEKQQWEVLKVDLMETLVSRLNPQSRGAAEDKRGQASTYKGKTTKHFRRQNLVKKAYKAPKTPRDAHMPKKQIETKLQQHSTTKLKIPLKTEKRGERRTVEFTNKSRYKKSTFPDVHATQTGVNYRKGYLDF